MRLISHNKLLIRIISITTVCLFVANDIGMANPDLLAPQKNRDVLQPALFTWATSDQGLIELAIRSYIDSVGLEAFRNLKHLYPTIRGNRVDLFVGSPAAGEDLSLIHI